MMEVAVESPQPAAWDHFKEKVEIMEEENGGASAAAAAAAAAAGELLTREIKKRLLNHAHENGNGHGHVNGGGPEELKVVSEEEDKVEEAPEEPKVAEEEQKSHLQQTILFDAAKGLWKCRHCDWTYRLSSPCGNGTVDHRGLLKPEHLAVESYSEDQAAEDPVMMPLQSEMQNSNDTTTKIESRTYAHHSHGTVVKPVHSITESSLEDQNTTTTTTTTTSATATTSSTTTSAEVTTHSSSSTGIFDAEVIEWMTDDMPPLKPADGVIMDATHHLHGHEDVHGTTTTTFENGSFTTHVSHTTELKVDCPNVTTIARGDLPTSPIPQAEDRPYVAVSVPEDVNPAAPSPQQSDDWDIPKAIVYGGLVESVTSLSVVSAAASSGAKTLDIFILGIANLMGGLPLIFHNIADLRDIRDVNEDNERVGHYWLQLGRRSKARLHMILALLSYIVFGLLPPILYGLSFRESNDRENKMMAVAGASLVCIALLALGKAHVKAAPRTYFKTLMYYLTVAVSSSGLSCVVGVLITRLLVHFEIIEQGGSAAPPSPGLSFPHSVGAQTSAWASF
ncbi:membrane protein of ER body-like protein isoform X2 [Triticum aestivum]|uniref:membrane protein of ER body-like protein isoform X2 n=1 Tax=Triticum aestivum TaxID=4565 RepID=UPI001D00CC3B|nr:membrane protein of ER body-like protein isoform X2 [Triticum aestivum]